MTCSWLIGSSWESNRQRPSFANKPSRILALAISTLCAATAAADDERHFDIAAQPLDSALLEVSRQGNVNVMAPASLTRGRQAPAVRGSMTASEALAQLLDTSRLRYRAVAEDSFIVESPYVRVAQNDVSASSAAPPAPARTVNEGAQPEEPPIDEIVVTARKREESILKVPVIASALDQGQLEQFATNDLFRIADRVPGLVIGDAVGSFGNQVSLRGVGTSVQNATIDQSISLNLDGLQLTQGLAYAAAMFDVRQATILKGPQALFYGKASPGGVIAIDSANPTKERELIARMGYEHEASTEQIELIASGPVSDTLGLRLAGRFSDSDGFWENKAAPVSGTGALRPKYYERPSSEDVLLRLTALWESTDRLSARLKVNYLKTEVQGSGGEGQLVSCPDGTESYTGIPFLGGENCRLDRTMRIVDMDPASFAQIKNGGTPYQDSRQTFGSLELNYALGSDLTLTSVTGYYDIDQEALLNGTLSAAAGPPLASQPMFARRDFTQEVRLASDYAGSPVNFLVGAFYQDADMDMDVDLIGNQSYGLPAKLQRGRHDVDIEALSVFGQLLWNIRPDLELGVGARWTEEKRTHTQVNMITGSPIVTSLAVPRLKSSNVSPELSLTYFVNDDLTLFGALKKAYKSGSFDTTVIHPANYNASFEDEKVQGGEIGMKWVLREHGLRINVAGYYYDYSDLQVGAPEINAGIIALRTVNAASSEIYGIDLDAFYAHPTIEGLSFYGALNWNHARYKDFDNAPCWGGQLVSEGCNRVMDPQTGNYSAQDISGRELLRAPDWMANVGVGYERRLGNDRVLSLALDATYSSSYYANIALHEGMKQDDYYKLGASVSLGAANDAWRVSLIGNNLNHELVIGNCGNSPLADGSIFGRMNTGGTTRGLSGVAEIQCNVDRGRSLWLRVSVRPSGI